MQTCYLCDMRKMVEKYCDAHCMKMFFATLVFTAVLDNIGLPVFPVISLSLFFGLFCEIIHSYVPKKTVNLFGWFIELPNFRQFIRDCKDDCIVVYNNLDESLGIYYNIAAYIVYYCVKITISY